MGVVGGVGIGDADDGGLNWRIVFLELNTLLHSMTIVVIEVQSL